MVGLSFLPAGNLPSLLHSKRVVLEKGRNGSMSLALPMPVVGSCIAGLFAVVGGVSLAVLSVKGITGVFWVGCVMFIAPCSVLSRNSALRLTWAMLGGRVVCSIAFAICSLHLQFVKSINDF